MKQQATCPKTRYQGSKFKLLPWLKEHLETLQFDTALDAFGGTASVSYLMKTMGKSVTYNDILTFNWIIGKALIENTEATLDPDDIQFILSEHQHIEYDDVIERSFHDIYYTDDENRWLDRVTQNIRVIDDEYKQAMAYWALFQACLSKRPYNLFHRKNLYVRTSEVKRTFGNKTTWDRPFEEHFSKFVLEINEAVFDNGHLNKATCSDALDVEGHTDLVYIDPPYIPQKGTLTRYRDFYHFLEGLVQYDRWPLMLDLQSKHKKLISVPSKWEDKAEIMSAFVDVFVHFQESTLVISYREDGKPSIDELSEALVGVGKEVEIHRASYQYTLSKKKSKEVLLIAR